jgi:hypothetical protein
MNDKTSKILKLLREYEADESRESQVGEELANISVIAPALKVNISGVETKILPVEYLVAIMLQLNRPKDRAKIDLLINNDEVSIDIPKLQQILTKHDLTKKWERFSDVG